MNFAASARSGIIFVEGSIWIYCANCANVNLLSFTVSYMAATLLLASEIEQLASILPDWEFLDGKLKRQWRFNDFPQAFAFMVRVAFIAETMGHHPNWSNSWNLVTIELITHDLGGLTNLDIKLAQQINCCV